MKQVIFCLEDDVEVEDDLVGHPSDPHFNCAYSRTGAKLAAATDSSLRIVDVLSGTQSCLFDQRGRWVGVEGADSGVVKLAKRWKPLFLPGI